MEVVLELAFVEIPVDSGFEVSSLQIFHFGAADLAVVEVVG